MTEKQTNDNLIIWFNRSKLPKGVPNLNKAILKDTFDVVKPKKIPPQHWTLYNKYKMEFPPIDNKYAFPKEMYLVIESKTTKAIQFDYLDYNGYDVKFVSADFLCFLEEHGLTVGYEKAHLNIVNLQGELLVTKPYYALRFGLYDDDLFDFSKQTKVRGKLEFGGTFYVYPDMKLKENNPQRLVFCIAEFSYRNALIFKKTIVKDILANFYAPEIYNIKDFPFVYANQYNWEILPFDNEYKLRP